MARSARPYEKVFRDRGYWGVGIYHPKKAYNIGTLLRNAYAFGASFVVTIGARFPRQAADTSRAWRHVPVYQYADANDFREHLPYRCKLVAVEVAEGAIELPRFVHPEQALYVLGAEDYGLPDPFLKLCDFHVSIPAAAFCLNVASAGTVVMYDRVCKRRDRLMRKISASAE